MATTGENETCRAACTKNEDGIGKKLDQSKIFDIFIQNKKHQHISGENDPFLIHATCPDYRYRTLRVLRNCRFTNHYLLSLTHVFVLSPFPHLYICLFFFHVLYVTTWEVVAMVKQWTNYHNLLPLDIFFLPEMPLLQEPHRLYLPLAEHLLNYSYLGYRHIFQPLALHVLPCLFLCNCWCQVQG